MTPDTRPLSAEERIERGYATIHALCIGKLRWEMRVPAEPDHDPDLILTDALGAARELLDAERARHAALPLVEAAQPIIDAAIDIFPEEWIDPESSMAMPVTLRGRDVFALRAALAATPAPLHRMNNRTLRCVVDGEAWPCAHAKNAATPAPLDARHAALVEAAQDDIERLPVHYRRNGFANSTAWVTRREVLRRLAALRAALDGEPR